jgi:cytochrome c-type biogenesis protein CcmH
MLFWIIVAVMTAAVAALILLPLLRAGGASAPAGRHDAEVYRDQLDELKRDVESGLMPAGEAALARAEVARRLLAVEARDAGARRADDQARDPAAQAGPATKKAGLPLANRLAQAAVIIVLPLVGLCLYLQTGSPELPDAPLAARLANPGDDIEILIAKAEQQLAAHPDDGAGYDVLAPIYFRSGRIDDAIVAYTNAIRLNGPSPQRLGGYAESLIARSGGLVASEARKALETSLSLEPNDPKARFYLALALEQDGKREPALAAFSEIVRTSPKGAPWLPLVNDHIARLQPPGATPEAQTSAATKLGGPDAAAIANAQAMSESDRRQMIEGMVASLAAKLKDDPRNLEGWQRIIRSYAVLGQRDKAEEALREGLSTYPAQSDEGRQLVALASELGIGVTDGQDGGATP